jgi:N-acetylglutamate synthase-like GNAT family acetyltransferase
MRVIMSTTIRPAIESDQDEIKSMVRAARINPRNLHWSRFLVAEDGGRIVGIRQVKIHKDGTREVASGVVCPEYRRQGISAKLMRAILAREPDPLYLMCDQKWAHYYEQFGFLRVEPSELPSDFRKEYRTVRIITSVLSLFVRRDIRLIPMKRET